MKYFYNIKNIILIIGSPPAKVIYFRWSRFLEIFSISISDKFSLFFIFQIIKAMFTVKLHNCSIQKIKYEGFFETKI